MRIILNLVIICIGTFPLIACKTTMQDGSSKVTIEDNNNTKVFCPPGQAKKGNC